jgi:hypothetical protein
MCNDSGRGVYGPSNCGSTQISAVHQTDAIQHTHSHDKTAVDAMDDLSLLPFAELALVWGAILRLVDIFHEGYSSLLEDIVVGLGGIVRGHDELQGDQGPVNEG